MTPLTEGCRDREAVACECDGAVPGYRFCRGGTLGACECAPPPVPSPGPCAPGDPEWCDGVDNDCDDAIDEGEVCPDSRIDGAEAFSGRVYAMLLEPSGPVLVSVWPDTAAPPITGLVQNPWRPRFRRTDGRLSFKAGPGPLFEWVEGELSEVSTPPCFSGPGSWGYGPEGDLFYACNDTLRRGAGERLASGWRTADELLGALSPTEMLVRRLDFDAGSEVHVLGLDGSSSATVDRGQWEGELDARPIFAPTLVRDRAYVGYMRSYVEHAWHELVVFRATAGGRALQRVRRVPTPMVTWYRGAVLPDGTVLAADDDRIVVYPTEGPPRTLLERREGDVRVDAFAVYPTR